MEGFNVSQDTNGMYVHSIKTLHIYTEAHIVFLIYLKCCLNAVKSLRTITTTTLTVVCKLAWVFAVLICERGP